MGKLFINELHNLHRTYQWALDTPIEKLCSFVNASHKLPLLVVGSGGSLTAAHMAALLHQETGMISKGITPLDLLSSEKFIRDASVLIVTSGGNNTDILSAFRFAATSEPRHLMAICMRTKSKLKRLSENYRYCSFYGFNLPSGKDGFLATNSLMAFITILIRAYTNLLPGVELPKSLPLSQEINEQISTQGQPLLEKHTWIVLYGYWGFPAAIDIESKCTEAALRRIQLADYRNFAHGRHHWLAKRGSETGVIALITPEEKTIAEKTLNLLPKDIPQLKLVTDKIGPVGGLELLVKIFHLIHEVGISVSIDPGKPGVPTFGRRLYHLKPFLNNSILPSPNRTTRQESVAILRKSKYTLLNDLTVEELRFWKEAFKSYVRKLQQTSFGTIVFDYDGTLCDPYERYKGPPSEIRQELVRLLEGGIVIGIATGRGKSVRTDLQHMIPEKYWDQMLIGYYNGSDIASLKDLKHPITNAPLHPALQSIKDCFEKHVQFRHMAKYECRPKQITVEPVCLAFWDKTKKILSDIITKTKFLEIQVLESSHSVDIIAPGVSKLSLVSACEKLAKDIGNSNIAICIGDKGAWPGNDYELLSTPYSLSVDQVSSDSSSCWNLSLAGHRGVQATLEYLKCFCINKAGILSINKII
jgi:hydroxymethylpyrimidine pyrophosphatase-like HAD family hydrolase